MSPHFSENEGSLPHPGPLGADGVDGRKPLFFPVFVERVFRERLVAPAEIGIEDVGCFSGVGIIGHGTQGKDLHERPPFRNRVGIGDGARYVPTEQEDSCYPAGGQKLHRNAVPAEAPDRFMENLTAFPVQFRILMMENEGVPVPDHGKDPGQEGRIPLVDIETFPKRLDHTPAGKFLQAIPEHEKMGQFARQCRALEMRMKKPVHADCRDFVEIGGVGGLEGGLAVQNGMAPVTETVEKKKDAAHVNSLGKILRLALGFLTRQTGPAAASAVPRQTGGSGNRGSSREGLEWRELSPDSSVQ